MLSKDVEVLLSDIYHANENIEKICLLKSDGNISLFLSKSPVEEGEKKRLIASIMASIVLAERSIVNLIQEKVTNLVIKGDNTSTIIFTTMEGNYLYVLAKTDFDYKNTFNFEFNF